MIEEHFSNGSHIYMRDSFEKCLENLGNIELVPILCSTHREKYLPFLIMEYLTIRFHFETKRIKRSLFSQDKAVGYVIR